MWSEIIKNDLTAPVGFGYHIHVETNHRGHPVSSRFECGAEVVDYQGVPKAHRVFLHREMQDGSRWNHDNARCAFFVPVRVENHRRHTMSEISDVADSLEVCRQKLSFLEDVFSQPNSDEGPELSPDGVGGLCFILRAVDEGIADAIKKITGGVA